MKTFGFKISIYSFLILFFISCADENETESIIEPPVIFLKFTSPGNGAQYVSGQNVNMKIKVNEPEKIQGNIRVLVGDSLLGELKPQPELEFDWKTTDFKVGKHRISIRATNLEGKTYADNRNIVIFSDLTPMNQEISIKKTHPHNPTYYTQGLEFDEFGNLVEGTGQKGSSLIAMVDYRSGRAIKEKELEKYYFGEGITIINGKIFQLTYQAGKCLVYDAKTFERINEYNYSGEGWGLSNDGEYIYMSNGSSTIQKRDPETFDLIDEIQVMDNQQEVVYLNELEYFDDKIYANIYQQNVIAEIDPKTGKVTAYIDCSLAYQEVSGGKVDVLNGIAYLKNTDRIFITGKWWPKLFEVTFVVKI